MVPPVFSPPPEGEKAPPGFPEKRFPLGGAREVIGFSRCRDTPPRAGTGFLCGSPQSFKRTSATEKISWGKDLNRDRRRRYFDLPQPHRAKSRHSRIWRLEELTRRASARSTDFVSPKRGYIEHLATSLSIHTTCTFSGIVTISSGLLSVDTNGLRDSRGCTGTRGRHRRPPS